MAKQTSTVEVLAGQLEQARRLLAKQAGTLATLEGRKVTLREEEGALIERMRRGADVARELAKHRDATRDLEDETVQAIRIHAALKQDEAARDVEHKEADHRAKVALAPVVVQQAMAWLGARARRILAVHQEVRGEIEGQGLRIVQDAQRIYREIAKGDENLEIVRGLAALQHVIVHAARELREIGEGVES